MMTKMVIYGGAAAVHLGSGTEEEIYEGVLIDRSLVIAGKKRRCVIHDHPSNGNGRTILCFDYLRNTSSTSCRMALHPAVIRVVEAESDTRTPLWP